MRDLLQKMKPDSFLDIIATSALYRPGPLEGGMVLTYVDVKHGRKPIPKVHPIVDEILEETYGVMVYQEQVMRILNRVGGIELPAAYRCIKAISKKKESVINSFKEEYVNGAKQRGVEESVAIDLFGLIEKFAGYGFNKSHSTAYGAVAYQTAYLKAHFPKEFMAALLSCGMESSDRISEHVDDARRMQITILPPDVNSSQVEFGIAGEAITFGLGAIKGVGEQALQALVDEREQNGPFRDIFDLTERVDPKALNRAALEILIKAGALDSFGPNRAQHLMAVDRAVQAGIAIHKDRQRGQKSLFGGPDDEASDDANAVAATLPDAPDIPHAQKLASEREVLGFYLTSHPLTEQGDRISQFRSHPIREVMELDEGAEVRLGGMVSSIKVSTLKKPNRNGHTRYANFDFEDTTGTVRCTMWAGEFARMGDMVQAEAVFYVEGRIDRKGREPNVIVNRIIELEAAEKQYTQQLAIKLQKGLHPESCFERIRDLLGQYPGNTNVTLVIDSASDDSSRPGSRYFLTLPASFRVSCSEQLRQELKSLLGKGYYQLVADKSAQKSNTNRSRPHAGAAAG